MPPRSTVATVLALTLAHPPSSRRAERELGQKEERGNVRILIFEPSRCRIVWYVASPSRDHLSIIAGKDSQDSTGLPKTVRERFDDGARCEVSFIIHKQARSKGTKSCTISKTADYRRGGGMSGIKNGTANKGKSEQYREELGQVRGVPKHLASGIAGITLKQGCLPYDDDTRVSVPPIIAMIESGFLFMFLGTPIYCTHTGE